MSRPNENLLPTNDRGRLRRIVQCLLLVSALAAQAAFAFGFQGSPSGPQRVLVVPVNLGTTLEELCPIPFVPPFLTPCPLTNQVAFYRNPRHKASEWQNLLDAYADRYWEFASYDKAQVAFTVLESPFTPDGWWKAPTAAEFYELNQNFYVDHAYRAYVEDPARAAIDGLCANPPPFYQYLCANLGLFDRIIVMTNKKMRGGVTNGSLPVTVNTNTQGDLQFTASLVNEDTDDSDALSVLLHEFGHQLGLPDLYAAKTGSNTWNDCSPYYVPAANAPLACLGFWDIMDDDTLWAQPTGWSRIHRGWLDRNDTLSRELFGTPFSLLTFIRPVERAPEGVPNLIRLATVGLNWPQFYGFYVECRRRVNGEGGLYPNTLGIPEEGLLITRVHEGGKRPLHVVRQVYPPGDPTYSALQPGDSYYDAQQDLFIRLNGYAGDYCDVEVDYQAPPRTGPIVLWQNRVTPEPVSGTGFGSYDIGMNALADPADAAGPLATAPWWAGHGNRLNLRAHTAGTLPASDVALAVTLTQPALFASACGTPREGDAQEVVLPEVDPVAGASAQLDFEPRRGSLGIQMVALADPASGREASNVVASRLDYQFFPAGGPRRRVTHIGLQANDDCEQEASLFHVLPAVVPEGWNVSVSPEVVSLPPGERAEVAVRITAPPGAQPGDGADIAIGVQETLNDTTRPGPVAGGAPVDPSLMKRIEPLGVMQILARVVGEPAVVELSCAAPRRPTQPGEPLSVEGRITPTPVSGAPVLLEYSWLRGKATRLITTDANGAFADRFVPSGVGRVRAQAFWPGDAMHAPAKSRKCPL